MSSPYAVSAQLPVPPGRSQPGQGRGQWAGGDCALQSGAGGRGQAGLLRRPSTAIGVLPGWPTRNGDRTTSPALRRTMRRRPNRPMAATGCASARAVDHRGRDVRSAAPARSGVATLPHGGVGWRRPVAGRDGAAPDSDPLHWEVAGTAVCGTGKTVAAYCILGMWQNKEFPEACDVLLQGFTVERKTDG